MPTITFASKLGKDGSLTVPKEAVEELGIRPGDEVQVSVQARNGVPCDSHGQVLSELLAQASLLHPEPPRPTSDPFEIAFGESLKEKYRKQGFEL